MNKTIKNKKKRNVTKKTTMCPIGLKRFEEEFSKTIPANQLTRSNEQRKKEFVKELTVKFAPSKLKPEND
jgi:hypothetical protein